MTNAIHSVSDFRRSSIGLILGLTALLFLVPLVSVNAQDTIFKDEVFGTLIELPDIYLAQLVQLAAVLDADEELMVSFMEAPREFLTAEGIDLPPDAFQITGVNFMVLSETEEEPWFGIAEPLEEMVFEPKGLGVFYESVAIFIQEAFEPRENGEITDPQVHMTDMFRFIGDHFEGDTLETLGAVMRALDALPADDQSRLEFLANPRAYLIDEGLTLPAHSYRIIAIDLNRAALVESVRSDEIRAGLGIVDPGIGVFYNNMGVFLQRAI